MGSTDSGKAPRRGGPARSLLLIASCACLALVLGIAALASAQAGTPQAAPPWLERAIGTAPVFARQAAAGQQQAEAPDPASRTEFRGLDAEEAADAASSAFPSLLQEPVDLGPDLHKGERIVGYQAPDIAKIALPDGGHAVADSVLPMLTETAAGKEVPVDLALGADSDSIGPLHPLVAVEIPRDLAEGIALPESGLTLTALSASGDPLHGAAGRVKGATAFFANTQADTDTLAKPLPLGFETQTILRSPASPEELRFAIGAPEDTTLSEAEDGSVMVETDGEILATVAPVTAVDAAGAPVALSEELDGDELVIEVGHRDGSYQYPIAVDPTVNQSDSFTEAEGTGNWTYGSNASSIFAGSRSNSCGSASAGCLKIADPSHAKYSYGQGGIWAYQTQGSSKIYELDTYFEGITSVETKAAAIIGIVNTSSSWEAEKFLGYQGGEYGVAFGKGPHTACAAGGCASSGGSASNVAVDDLVATGNGEFAESNMLSATVKIAQSEGPSASFDTSSKEIEGKPNALYSGQWVKSSSEAKIKATGTDPGLGIYKRALTAPSYSSWSKKIVLGAAGGCVGVQCDSPYSFQAELGNLPEGENTVEAKVENATGSSATKTATVKIDNTAPFASVTNLPEDGTVALGHTYHLEFSFGDGKSPTASSGVAEKTAEVKVDGEQMLSATGAGGCTPGPCQISRSVDLDSEDLGAGMHTMALIVKDNAGNESTTNVPFVVAHGPLLDVGPGKVDAANGDFSYNATDVSAGPGLSVVRTHEAHIDQSAFNSNPVQMNWGGGWTMSLGGWQGVTKLGDGSAALVDPHGRTALFTPTGGGSFKTPLNYSGWTLKYSEAKPATYTLTDANGNVTTFQRPGETGSFYPAHTFEGPGGTSHTTFQFSESADKKFRPSTVIGPIPTGVSCASPARGCRILHFHYATSTTASGLDPGKWGDYKYQLHDISLEAWDPESEEMTDTSVVEYAYDSNGRLRASWDPRISPELKTTYGYRSASSTQWELAVLTPPGQQPWILNYGKQNWWYSRDWLTSVSRPPATTPLKPEAAEPVNTALPHQQEGPPIVGVPRHIWNGSWSGEPLAYSYQWQICGLPGITGCKLIPRTFGPTYTPVAADIGGRLRVKVTATNGSGAGSAWTSSPDSYPVIGAETSHYVPSCELSQGAPEGTPYSPAGAVVDPTTGNLWTVDGQPEGEPVIKEFAPECGELLNSFGYEGSGYEELSEPHGIAMNEAGELFVADTGHSRVAVFDQSGEFVREIGGSKTEGLKLSEPMDVDVGDTTWSGGGGGTVWVADPGSGVDGIARYEETGGPLGLQHQWADATWSSGYRYFADPTGIAVGHDRDFLADDGADLVIGLNASNKGSIFHSLEEMEATSIAIASPGSEDHFFVGRGGEVPSYWGSQRTSSVFEFDQSGTLMEEFAEQPSGVAPPSALAVGPGGEVYIGRGEGNNIEMWDRAKGAGGPESESPPSIPKMPTWILDYDVPLSGEGAPQQMDKEHIAEWGQTKTPTSATAIFPPDAGEAPSDYKRATIYYMDIGGRNIDTATPGGRVEAREYDSHENITRTLSPSNRQRALELKGSSAERAALSHELDTQYTYGSEGQELSSVLGPKHTVKLDNDTKTQGRLKSRYYYDEGAPEGKTFHLPTKETEAALVGSEEQDVKTKTFSYSGQSGLGWELEKPTSTTIDPGGLGLTEKTVYDPATGAVVETTKPAEPEGGDLRSERTIYYSSEENEEAAECGGHPEWEGLPCQAKHGESEVPSEEAPSENPGAPYGVSCPSSTYCVRVGGTSPGALIEAWNGSEWTSQSAAVPSEGSWLFLSSVSCTSSTACTAVGQYYKGAVKLENLRPLIERWNGSTWSVQSAEFSAWVLFRAVSCDSSTSCTAVGEGGETSGFLTRPKAAHWNGTSWTTYAVTPKESYGGYLFDVSCTSSSACTAVGHYSSEKEGMRSLVERFDGTGWTQQTVTLPSVPGTTSEVPLTGVSCTSATACVAVGRIRSEEYGEYDEELGEEPLIEYHQALAGTWNGTSWSMQVAAAPSGKSWTNLSDVSCVSASDCIAIGRSTDVGKGWPFPEGPIAEHWNGSSWSMVSSPLESETGRVYLEGLSCVTAKFCMATGYVPSGSKKFTVYEQWNGSNWGLNGKPQEAIDLPISTTTYNLYNQPLTTTETVGEEATRTASVEYDGAGRPLTSGLVSSEGTELEPVSTVYDEETGQPVMVHNEAESIVQEYDSLGRLTSYTDADGNESTYAYDEYGRLKETYDGKGTQTRTYDAETGELSKLEDTALGTFKATYDADGRLATETAPNGLKAIHTYNEIGSQTKVAYEKTTKCSEKCTWYTDEALSSIQGKTRSRTSTLGSFGYTYDASGRLTKVQDTPAGEGCTTRLYGFDADTDINSVTTRSPGGGGLCAESGGSTVTHSFDSADRLADEGTEYNAFGDITELQAADAGGYDLTATYYADDTTASLTQNGVTTSYDLDPMGRNRRIATTGGEAAGETISHFSGSGDSPSWTSDGKSGWVRYVGGIGGGLGAIQQSTGSTELQVSNLHGDVVASVANSESATKLEFGSEATEYGVPRAGKTPKKYSWLGSAQRSTEFPSGVVSMGARTYVPAIGRFLQTDPVPGGSPNPYAYTWGDPVNQSDIGGEYTPSFPTWLLEVIGTAPSMPPPPSPPAVEAEEEMELGSFRVSGGGWGDASLLLLPVSVCPLCMVGEKVGPAAVSVAKRVLSEFRRQFEKHVTPTVKAVTKIVAYVADQVINWIGTWAGAHKEELKGCAMGMATGFLEALPGAETIVLPLISMANGCILGYIEEAERKAAR